MNKILLLLGLTAILSVTGCVVAEDRHPEPYREHARFERQPEVIVPDPVVVVRPPEIIVR